MADMPQIMDANLPMSIDSQTVFPWLSLIVLLPIAGALIMPFLPKEESKKQRKTANHSLVTLSLTLSVPFLSCGDLARLESKKTKE